MRLTHRAFFPHLSKVIMKKISLLVSVAAVLAAGAAPFASATCVGAECDMALANVTNTTTNSTVSNSITTHFSEESNDAAWRLKSVYGATGNFSQNNTAPVRSESRQDYLITNGHDKGDVSVDVTAIGNNLSANLVGMKSVNLSVDQRNAGAVSAVSTTLHPNVGGNLEIATTAIGNNAGVNWDLTTDKNPSSDNFAVKKDGAVRGFDAVGSFVGSITQCNTGGVGAQTFYSQDPAANIKISTTAIANNISFGVKTR